MPNTTIEYIDLSIEDDFKAASNGDYEAICRVDEWFKNKLDRSMKLVSMTEEHVQ